MKSCDIYSIGSALVDLQFTVPFSLLEALAAEKGGTHLIDEGMEHKLRSLLKNQTPKKFCGGTGANTLAALHYMGGTGFYSCHVADDAEGHFYHDDLRQRSIASNLDLQALNPGITGRCNILITPDAERTLFTLLGASEKITTCALYEVALSHAKYVFIEGFLLCSPHSKQVIPAAYNMAKKHGVKTALSLSTCFLSLELKQELLASIPDGVDLLFCNEQEAQHFCGTDNMAEVITTLSQIAKRFVITQGKKGALLYDGHKYFTIPSIPTEIIDTTGAGDAFAGSFLYACCRGETFETAGQIASHAAAKVISQFGPRI